MVKIHVPIHCPSLCLFPLYFYFSTLSLSIVSPLYIPRFSLPPPPPASWSFVPPVCLFPFVLLLCLLPSFSPPVCSFSLHSISLLYLSALSLSLPLPLHLFPSVSTPMPLPAVYILFLSLLSLLYISPLCISPMFLSFFLFPLYLWSSISLFCIFSSVYHPVSPLCLSS